MAMMLNDPINSEDSSEGNTFDQRFKQIEEINKQETWPEWGQRFGSQLGARSAELIVGMPGNLKNAFKEAQSYVDSMIPEFLQLEDSGKKIKEENGSLLKPESGSIEDYIMNPPTSSELKQYVTKPLSKALTENADYLEPRDNLEKASGEFTQDLISMFMPGSGGLNMFAKVGAPLTGLLTKEGFKFFGADESTAEKAKLGVMLGTTIASQSNPLQFSRNRIAQARQMIPQGITVPVQNLLNRLIPIQRRLNRGLGVPSKSRTQQGINDLSAQFQNGRMDLHSLMDARDNINEWIAEAGGWDVPAQTRDATVRNLNDLKSGIIDTINENMITRYPEAYELYNTGYQAAAVTHRSQAISNFIERNFGKKAKSVGAKILFPSMVGGAAVLPKTAFAAGGLFPIYKSGQVLYRIGQSPTLARYYSDVIRHSLQGNSQAMANSLSKLDESLSKEEKQRHKNTKLSLDEFKSNFILEDQNQE